MRTRSTQFSIRVHPWHSPMEYIPHGVYTEITVNAEIDIQSVTTIQIDPC